MFSSLVLRSLHRLDISSRFSTRNKRIQLIKSIPSFKLYILQSYSLDIIFRSLTPPLFSFSFQTLFPLPPFFSFDILGSSSRKKMNWSSYCREAINSGNSPPSPLVNDDIASILPSNILLGGSLGYFASLNFTGELTTCESCHFLRFQERSERSLFSCHQTML